jgi:hypothetical protein
VCAEQRVESALSTIAKVFLTGVAGIALGLWLSFLAVDRGPAVGTLSAGAWVLTPRGGAPDADPYARAAFAKSGELPLGIADGLSLVAASDSAGRPLDPRCDYRVSGPLPVARFWTLSVMTPHGRPLPSMAGRAGFTSSELVRSADGDYAIVLAREARPGNWLQLPAKRDFVLMLRLYDTAEGGSDAAIEADHVPTIAREHCA